MIPITGPIGEDPFFNVGMYVPASIGQFVWEDMNGNGLRDPDKPGLDDVTVVLTGTDGMGNVVDLATVTDASGIYGFDNLAPGIYTVNVITGIDVGPADVGTGYLFGELGLKYPSKQLLLTTDPKSLILIRDPGRGVIEVNRVMGQEQTLELTVDRLDVNRDGFVIPADALFVINQVNYSLSASGSYRPATQADVNGDGRVTALDALLVINYLNQAEQQHAEAEYGGAEGEAWRFDDHAPTTLWENDSNREIHPGCTTWCEQEEAEDWDGWRVWNEGTVDDLVDLGKFDDRADDDPRLGEIIAILARDDARPIAFPLV